MVEAAQTKPGETTLPLHKQASSCYSMTMATELVLFVSALTNTALVFVGLRGRITTEKLASKFDKWQKSFSLYLQRRAAEDNAEGTRWVALVATSPSGKSQWVCSCCGRLSATPDVSCPIGAHVTIGGETRIIPCARKEHRSKDRLWDTKH